MGAREGGKGGGTCDTVRPPAHHLSEAEQRRQKTHNAEPDERGAVPAVNNDVSILVSHCLPILVVDLAIDICTR